MSPPKAANENYRSDFDKNKQIVPDRKKITQRRRIFAFKAMTTNRIDSIPNAGDQSDRTIPEWGQVQNRRSSPGQIQRINSPCVDIPDWQSQKCLVCSNQLVFAVFMPCGHAITCDDCAEEVSQTTNKCFMCNMNLSSVLYIDRRVRDNGLYGVRFLTLFYNKSDTLHPGEDSFMISNGGWTTSCSRQSGIKDTSQG